jgi:hypothetical protein
MRIGKPLIGKINMEKPLENQKHHWCQGHRDMMVNQSII